MTINFLYLLQLYIIIRIKLIYWEFFVLYKYTSKRKEASRRQETRPEKMGSIPKAKLGSTDKTIPLVGFGTAEFPFGASSETMKDSILHAIKLGYRHFDSAALYQSEQPLAEAISEALQLGLVKSRDELFITSKLWCSDAHHDCVLPALRKTLK